ncbi:small ubiquitin-related modifier 2-A-like isoform X2 [Cetorhinus maximus]
MAEDKAKGENVKSEGNDHRNDHINLKVAGQDGSVVQFKIKKQTPLSKLMKAYCERQPYSPESGCSPPLCSSATELAMTMVQGLADQTDPVSFRWAANK